MKDGEDGFLSRWARRKAEAKRDDKAPADVDETAPDEASGIAKSEAEFDISSLPSLESLTADSDFTGFLQKGVPQALRNAALQRLWTSDPMIRDYVGLSEMNWDFNAAEAFHGYGALAPGTDVASMVSDISEHRFVKMAEALLDGQGEAKAKVESESARAETALPTPKRPEPSDDAVAETSEDSTIVESQNAVATRRRRHGGAAPR